MPRLPPEVRMPQKHTTQNHTTPPDRGPPGLTVASGPFAGAVPLAGLAQELPLHGVTLLAVEDSRFACEALRLMARRAGARLRRAETIAAARAHLRVYRPDVVLVDLGLPDGKGEGLIRELVTSPRRPGVVMGISGLADGRALALAAGADGFIEKPLENLAQLCRVLRPFLPELDIHPPPIGTAPALPDPLALQDDLAFAAAALQGDPGPERQSYVSAFVSGLAQHARDEDLAHAARSASGSAGLDRLRSLIAARLDRQAAFARPL